jgi:hypothetical protein
MFAPGARYRVLRAYSVPELPLSDPKATYATLESGHSNDNAVAAGTLLDLAVSESPRPRAAAAIVECDAERLRGVEVDGQIEFRWVLDLYVARGSLGPLQEA